MRMNHLGALAAMSLAATLTSSGGVFDEAPTTPPRKRPKPDEHKHSREIARRLRQEARKAAKARGEQS